MVEEDGERLMHKSILVTKYPEKSIISIPLEDVHSYEETAYLIKSAKNVARLDESILELEERRSSKELLEE